MINKSTEESMVKFFHKFTNSTIRCLYSTLDKDIYKKIQFSVDSFDEIHNMDSLKEEGYTIYRLKYQKTGKELTLAVLIQEPLIATISDVIMGGSGENAYKGSLSELELNATFDLLKTIFKEVAVVYNKICEQEIIFEEAPTLLDKSAEGYSDAFNNLGCDFMVNYTLTFNGKNSYKIKTLLKYSEIKLVLTRLGLFQGETPRKKRVIDSLNISLLNDIDIEMVAELGKTQIPMKQALELTSGSMIELNTNENDDVSIYAKGIEVAKAQIVVVGDNIGLRVTKLIPPEERE